MLLFATLEQVSSGGLGLSLGNDGLDHSVLLLDRERVLGGCTGQSGDDSVTLSLVSVLHEPSRRLGKDGNTGKKDDGEEDLECHGESPRNGALHCQNSLKL